MSPNLGTVTHTTKRNLPLAGLNTCLFADWKLRPDRSLRTSQPQNCMTCTSSTLFFSFSRFKYFQNWRTTLGPTSQIPPHRHISDFLRTPRPEAPASNHEASSAFRNMYTRVQVQPYLNLKQGTCKRTSVLKQRAVKLTFHTAKQPCAASSARIMSPPPLPLHLLLPAA